MYDQHFNGLSKLVDFMGLLCRIENDTLLYYLFPQNFLIYNMTSEVLKVILVRSLLLRSIFSIQYKNEASLIFHTKLCQLCITENQSGLAINDPFHIC